VRNLLSLVETSVVFHSLVAAAAAAAAAGNAGADFSVAFCAHTVDDNGMAPAYLQLF